MPKITHDQYIQAQWGVEYYYEKYKEAKAIRDQYIFEQKKESTDKKELRVYQTQERSRDSRLDCTATPG